MSDRTLLRGRARGKPVVEACLKEGWLESALKFGGIAAWSWLVDEDVLEYTSEFETIFGPNPEGAKWNYRSILARIHADDRDAVDRAVQKAITEGGAYHKRFRFIQADNSVHWIEGRGEIDPEKSVGSPVMNGVVRDITEQQQHAVQFQSIIEKTPNIAVQGYDLEGRVLFWNKASEKQFGWTAEQAIGKRLEEFLNSQQDADYFRNTVRQLLNTGLASGPTEFTVNRPDGSRTHCLSTIFQIADSPHGPAFVCMDVDITDRKQLESALRESQERYTSLFDLSPDAISVMDMETSQVTQVSQGFGSVFGFSPEEAVGKTPLELGVWNRLEDRQRFRELLSEKGSIIDFEAEGIRKDGRVIYCSVSGNLVNVGGRQLLMAVARDITDRKNSELQLRHSEEWFRSLIEFSSDLIHIVLPDGTLIYESPSAHRILGYTDEEAGDRNVFEFIHPDDHHVVRNALQQLVKYPELPCKAEFRVLAASGEWLYFDARARNLIDRPAIAGIVVNSRNVSDRRFAEERTLLQIERLKSLHTIDTAISGSLDLKVALNVVMNETMSQLQADGVLVRVLRPDSSMLEVASEAGLRPFGDVGPVHLGAGMAGRAVMESRVLQGDGRFPGDDCIDPTAKFVHVCAPLIAKGRANGVLQVWVEKGKLADSEWFAFLEMLAGQTAIAVDNVLMFEAIQRSNLELVMAYDSTIEGWSKALELRDKETEGHTKRVTELSVRLARIMGFSESAIVQVRRGALLHDIGKMGIPDEILLKPDRLTEEEFNLMKRHTEYAFEWLSPIPFLREAIEIPYCHHERWDGEGYPRGLKGEQIPVAARVFAVVDVFDALTSDRPYRKAMELEDVLEFIANESGKHFDPQVARAFLDMMIADRFISEMA